MYISAFPVAITIRNSNVYEERSLGIYSGDPGYEEEQMGSMSILRRFLHMHVGRPSATKEYFVQQQLRAQLAHDIWWLVLAVWLIMIIENHQFVENPAVFSVFNVIFEVVSGKWQATSSEQLLLTTCSVRHCRHIHRCPMGCLFILRCVAYFEQIDLMRRHVAWATSWTASSHRQGGFATKGLPV